MFSTPVNIPPSDVKISYHHPLMTLGSCFAENIGKRLSDAFFRVEINPFGVLYNPVSVAQSIKRLVSNDEFTSNDVFENQSLWHSFSYSSLFSGVTAEECVKNINERLLHAREFIQRADFLLITLGTAWVYEDVQSGKVVANCHKLPANHFTRRRLTVEEIVVELSAVLLELKAKNESLNVIFTVSPVRHWKDGAHANNVSKATLHLAVEQLKEKLPFTHYFPAYEIQMDELRDYRFYASDMLHPSQTAVDYIWKRFAETYFDKETEELKKQLEQLRADLHHRPLHPQSNEYQSFLKNIDKRKTDIKNKYPFIDF